MNDEVSPPRPGSSQDLSRRMDRMEQNHEALAKEVASLTGTVARMELNQVHQAELNKLRFDSLDTGIGTVNGTLERFMGRINAIITGEVRLPQNDALMATWNDWRDDVDADRKSQAAINEQQAVLNGKVLLTGSLGKLLITSNILSWLVAIAALVK